MNQNFQKNTANNFYGLGIAPALLAILDNLHFKTPTPIQAKAIPVAIAGKDLVGIAQTGTGKTLAFGVPLIQRLARVKGQGLVVLPTRELALQVDETLRQVGHGLGLRTAVLIGGTSLGPQVKALAKKPHVFIATPGRLIDHLEQKNLRLDGVCVVVLDEADRMLDMGFLPQIQKILSALPKDRQTMLFSATMPSNIMKLATAHMKLPIRVEIAPSGTLVENITQEVFIISKEQKIGLLAALLEKYQGPVLVFTKTKHGAKKVVQKIRAMGVSSAELHSNRSLNQRKEALNGFKSGKYRVLVATDIASRGIDVIGIELVLNYDLPMNSEDYVHRIGRTARAGAGGHAITFAMPGEQKGIAEIERLIRKNLPVSELPEFPMLRVPNSTPTRYHPRYAPRRAVRHTSGHSSGGFKGRSRYGRHGFAKKRLS